MQTWFFYTAPDKTILMQCRAEGPGGMIGDLSIDIQPGQPTGISGLTYDELFAAGGGTISVDADGGYVLGKVDPSLAGQ